MQAVDFFTQKINYIFHHIFVLCFLLHFRRQTAGMHENIGHRQCGNGRKHIFIKHAAGNVINDMCTLLHRHFRHLRAIGIYRNDSMREVFFYNGNRF